MLGVETRELVGRRDALVHRARDGDAPDDAPRVAERTRRGLERTLALHRVLDEMRREAVQAEAHVDVQLAPLRRQRELVVARRAELGVGLGAADPEALRDLGSVAFDIDRLWLRAPLRGQRERLLGAAAQRMRGVRTVRALDGDRVPQRLARAPLALARRAVERGGTDAGVTAARHSLRYASRNASQSAVRTIPCGVTYGNASRSIQGT